MPEDQKAPQIIGNLGWGRLMIHGIPFDALDTAHAMWPDKPIDLLFVPLGQLAPLSAVQIHRGTIVTFIAPEIARQIRGQINPLGQQGPPKSTLHT